MLDTNKTFYLIPSPIFGRKTWSIWGLHWKGWIGFGSSPNFLSWPWSKAIFTLTWSLGPSGQTLLCPQKRCTKIWFNAWLLVNSKQWTKVFIKSLRAWVSTSYMPGQRKVGTAYLRCKRRCKGTELQCLFLPWGRQRIVYQISPSKAYPSHGQDHHSPEEDQHLTGTRSQLRRFFVGETGRFFKNLEWTFTKNEICYWKLGSRWCHARECMIPPPFQLLQKLAQRPRRTNS